MESGVLRETQFSFRTRFENGIGTNPEELLAAASLSEERRRGRWGNSVPGARDSDSGCLGGSGLDVRGTSGCVAATFLSGDHGRLRRQGEHPGGSGQRDVTACGC